MDIRVILSEVGAFKESDVIKGIICIVAFGLAIMFFVFLLWEIRRN